MVWEGKERRRFLRKVFHCKIAVGSPLRWLTSHIEELSTGGLRVILEERLNIFAPVSLELFLEKKLSVKCKGKVVWVEEEVNPVHMENEPVAYITGIEFTQMQEKDKQYIKRLIKILSIVKKGKLL